jgi:hypothetical protein
MCKSGGRCRAGPSGERSQAGEQRTGTATAPGSGDAPDRSPGRCSAAAPRLNDCILHSCYLWGLEAVHGCCSCRRDPLGARDAGSLLCCFCPVRTAAAYQQMQVQPCVATSLKEGVAWGGTARMDPHLWARQSLTARVAASVAREPPIALSQHHSLQQLARA